MVVKSHPILSDVKIRPRDDDDVSSRASLSSASVNTLEIDEPLHEDNKSKQAPEYTSRSPRADEPPSYEDATSTASSLYTSSRGPPSVAQTSTSDTDKPVSPTQRPVAIKPADPTGAASLRDKKVKIRDGDVSLHSAETITGPIIINGKLTIYGNVRFIGALQVSKSITIHGSMTCDGYLCVGKDISVHGNLTVAESADLFGKVKNYGKLSFAKDVTHRNNVANYSTITYGGSVDYGLAKIKNYGTIYAEHGVGNVGKVDNHGTINGFTTL